MPQRYNAVGQIASIASTELPRIKEQILQTQS
jgi:hypothetical protein